MTTETRGATCGAGYRVTSGSPLELVKFLRGDTYTEGLNDDLDAIDARLSLDTDLNATQAASVAGQLETAVGQFANLLGNGGFDHWQRGTSITGASRFTADLWKVDAGFLGTVSRGRHLATEAATAAGSLPPYSAVVSSAVATPVLLYQRVLRVGQLAGTTVQFSASLVTTSASRFRLAIRDSVGSYTYSSYATGTGAEERLSVALSIAAGATWIEVALVGTISAASQTVSASDAALYVGSPSAPPYVPCSPLQDLYRVLRAHFRPSAEIFLPAADAGFSPYFGRPVQTPVPMESASPTVSVGGAAIGADAVALDEASSAGAGAAVLGTSGGSVTADPAEHLTIDDLSLSADPF